MSRTAPKLKREISEREKKNLFHTMEPTMTSLGSFAHLWCFTANLNKTCLIFQLGAAVPANFSNFLKTKLLHLGFEFKKTTVQGQIMFKTSTPPTLAAKEAFRCDVCSRLRGHIKHISPGLSSEKDHDSATDLLYQLSLSVLGVMIHEKLVVNQLQETNEELNKQTLGSSSPKEDTTVLGFNENKGDKICIFLRPKMETRRNHQQRGTSIFDSDVDCLFDIPQLTQTMLHELAHNKHGSHTNAHPKEFWNYFNELKKIQYDITHKR